MVQLNKNNDEAGAVARHSGGLEHALRLLATSCALLAAAFVGSQNADAAGGCSFIGSVLVNNCEHKIGTQTTTDMMVSIVDGVSDRALDLTVNQDLATDGRENSQQLSPTVGTFTQGSFSYTRHDGYEVSGTAFGGAAINGDLGAFESTKSSIVGSVIFNLNSLSSAAAHGWSTFLGFYGGYAENHVKSDAPNITPGLSSGKYDHETMLAGVYGIAARGNLYMMGSLAGFWGETNTLDRTLGSGTANYGTKGYVAKAVAGRKFPTGNDGVTFDLRGGLIYADFTGEDFTDSVGAPFKSSQVSFEEFSGFLSAGVFKTMVVGEYVVQPYVKAAVRQVFYETNRYTDPFGDVLTFSANDDTHGRIAGGFLARISNGVSFSGEAYGDFTGDSETVGCKLGVKFKLN